MNRLAIGVATATAITLGAAACSSGSGDAGAVEQAVQEAANQRSPGAVSAVKCLQVSDVRWTCNVEGSDGSHLTVGATVSNGTVITDSNPQ